MVVWLCYTALCSGFSVHDTSSNGFVLSAFVVTHCCRAVGSLRRFRDEEASLRAS